MLRRTPILLFACGLAVPCALLAGELTPEQIAHIRRDEQAAIAKVNTAHGNKKPSEMDNAERRQVIEEQQQALQAVMDKHGVTPKEYARQSAQMGREESKAVEAAAKELEAQEKAATEAAAAAAAQPAEEKAPEEIPIQRGFNDENPVEVEATPDAPPILEFGLPKEEQQLLEGTLPSEAELPSR
jgi:hypothetical protein